LTICRAYLNLRSLRRGFRLRSRSTHLDTRRGVWPRFLDIPLSFPQYGERILGCAPWHGLWYPMWCIWNIGNHDTFCATSASKQIWYRITLRTVAVTLTLLTGPLIPLLKGRVAVSSQQTAIHPWNWTFLRAPLVWVCSVSNKLQGFGYSFPSLYLPSYASSIGLSTKSGALLLALMSIFQVGEKFVFGLLSDRKVPLDVLASVFTVVAAIARLAIWRTAESLPVLVAFAIVYGFFTAGFTARYVSYGISRRACAF
jgi:hypothetical protein